jgi:hypothetical protein
VRQDLLGPVLQKCKGDDGPQRTSQRWRVYRHKVRLDSVLQRDQNQYPRTVCLSLSGHMTLWLFAFQMVAGRWVV